MTCIPTSYDRPVLNFQCPSYTTQGCLKELSIYECEVIQKVGLACLLKLHFNLAVSQPSPIKCGLDFRFYCVPTAPLHEAERLC